MRFLSSHVLIVTLLGCVVLSSATVYFKEDFNDAGWEERWKSSQHHKKDGAQGKFKWTAGKWYGDADDKGIQTSEDARFYGLTTLFPEFSNAGKDLIIQFNAKHEQKIDCGGAYLKVGYWDPEKYDPTKFHGDTDYKIMFGPDVCGYTTKKVHAIFNYKGKNLEKKDEIKLVTEHTDQLSHLYTLIVHPDMTYEVEIDEKSKAKGSVLDQWPFLPPKEIPDPSAKKPADWVDAAEIPDPEDVKPEGWDEIPAEIKDPNAEKPDDWDDELDGEWEAPMIPNPEYKGEWKPRMIPNPAYKGEWIHPKIENPEYFEDDKVVAYDKINYIGIDIWQVMSGTVFDNFIITDTLSEARDFAAATWKAQKAGEKAMFDEIEKERKAKEDEERKKREEERKKKEEEERVKDKEEDEEEEDEDEHEDL